LEAARAQISNRQRMEETRKRELEIGEQVAQAELTIKQQHEVARKLEGDDFADAVFAAVGKSELKEQLTAFEEKVKRDLEDKIRQAMTTAANTRSPTC